MSISPPPRSWGHDETICRRYNAAGDELSVGFYRNSGISTKPGQPDADSYQASAGGRVLITSRDPGEVAREVVRRGYLPPAPRAGGDYRGDWVDQHAGTDDVVVQYRDPRASNAWHDYRRCAAGDVDAVIAGCGVTRGREWRSVDLLTRTPLDH